MGSVPDEGRVFGEGARARVRLWLSRRRLAGAAFALAAAGALLVAALAALLACYAFFYVLLSLLFDLWDWLPETPRGLIPFALIALLFLENWRQSRKAVRRRLEDLRFETGSALGDEVMRRAPPRVRAMMMNPVAPGSAGARRLGAPPVERTGALVKIGAMILLAGPRLAAAGIGELARARRLFTMDVRPCARVLALVYERGERVPFEEIVQEIPGLNPVGVLTRLADIDGVMFHASEPPGMSLTDDLRADIARATGVSPG